MDCHVYLQPTTEPLDCATIPLDVARLGELREFIAGVRKSSYLVSDEVPLGHALTSATAHCTPPP